MASHEIRTNRIEPLWDRVDRNRIELAIFLTLFFTGMTIALAALLLVTAAAITLALMIVAAEAGQVDLSMRVYSLVSDWFPVALVLSAGVVAGYMAWALGRDERWFARRMEAALAPRGDLLDTKYALKDMAIASGFDVAPALYVLETPNVNAFVFQHRRRRAIVGVTRGLVTRLTNDEQRAVFANLMARLRAGDMLWASAVTALMSPLWHFYEKPLGDAEVVKFKERLDPQTGTRHLQPVGADAVLFSPAVALPLFALASVFVVVSELLAFGHRRSQLHHAEVADGEGMLLLKDPRSMLSALEKSVRFNNYVPTAGPGMAQLFYAWTGDGSTNDEEDPENARVSRLREVLGVEGMAPPVVKPNKPAFHVAPPAPRLEE